MKINGIKHTVNSAEEEIKNCFKLIEAESAKVINLVTKHYNALPNALVMSNGFCKNKSINTN